MTEPARLAPHLALMLLGAACRLTLPSAPSDAPAANDAGLHDAGHPRLDAGAGSREDAAVDANPSLAGHKHPSCDRPIPQPVPDAPIVRTDTSARPQVDSWLDLVCEDVAAHPTCEQFDGTYEVACAQCLGSAQRATGVCAEDGPVPDHELCVPFHDVANACWLCVPPVVKARACCLELEVECRPSRDPTARAPFYACTRHEDCEDGLLCVDDGGYGGSVCACPGAIAQLPRCRVLRVEGEL